MIQSPCPYCGNLPRISKIWIGMVTAIKNTLMGFAGSY